MKKEIALAPGPYVRQHHPNQEGYKLQRPSRDGTIFPPPSNLLEKRKKRKKEKGGVEGH
jgi:hypothetical protein